MEGGGDSAKKCSAFFKKKKKDVCVAMVLQVWHEKFDHTVIRFQWNMRQKLLQTTVECAVWQQKQFKLLLLHMWVICLDNEFAAFSNEKKKKCFWT